jgi:CRP/FNR family cyclic AMP-dependent transcriptional regulator
MVYSPVAFGPPRVGWPTLIRSKPVDAIDLKSVPLFAGLNKRERELVARFADEIDVPTGKVLTREGGPSQEFFVITSGSATVTRDGGEVGRLGPGDFFGEIGILRSEPRTATVTADTPMRLLVLFAQNFTALDHELAELRGCVERAMAERMPAE